MKSKAKFIFPCIFLILLLGNVFDIYRISIPNTQYQFKYYTETTTGDAWMVGSLFRARYHGLFHTATFSNRYLPVTCDGLDSKECSRYMIEQFKNGKELYSKGNWDTYKSGLRLPMSLYTVVDYICYKITGKYSNTMGLIEFIETVLLSFVFSLFIWFIYQKTNFSILAVAVLFILFTSQFNHINVLSSLWVRFLPFGLLPIFLSKDRLEQPGGILKFSVIVFIIFALNQSVQYELTTITAGMILSMVLLFTIINDININLQLRIWKMAFIAMFLAFVFVLIVHFLLLVDFYQDFELAKDWFIAKLSQRTYPDYFDQLQASQMFENRHEYSGSILDLMNERLSKNELLFSLNGKHFILIYGLSLIVGLITLKFRKSILEKQKRTIKGFILAPLPILLGLTAYFIIFKSHAGGHEFVASFINYGFSILVVISTCYIAYRCIFSIISTSIK